MTLGRRFYLAKPVFFNCFKVKHPITHKFNIIVNCVAQGDSGLCRGMNRLSVTFFQRHIFSQFNVYVQKAYSAGRAAESQPDDETAWVGIQNPAEYHIKGNGHNESAHTR